MIADGDFRSEPILENKEEKIEVHQKYIKTKHKEPSATDFLEGKVNQIQKHLTINFGRGK